MPKLLVVARLANGSTADQLLSALRTEGEQLLAADNLITTFRVARPAVVSDISGSAVPRYEQIVERGLSNGVRLGGIDAILDLTVAEGALPALIEAAEGMAKRIGPALDTTTSAVVAGDVHLLLDGVGDFQLFYCMRRIDGVTHDEFSQFWLSQHSAHGLATPGLKGYLQLHADLDASVAAAAAVGVEVADLDGVALEWFSTMDAFIAAVTASPSHGKAAKSSESAFNDIERAEVIITPDNETPRTGGLVYHR
jgi:hypothetical protein